MERIAIIGRSGSGKSTVARALGKALDLPVIHLDVLFWKPGWVEGDHDELRKKVEAAAMTRRWIIEGNFSDSSTLRFRRADTIVWLDPPKLTCLTRAVSRAVAWQGKTRPDLAPGCPEKYDLAFYRYIWGWDRTTRPRLQAAVDAHGARAAKVRLSSDEEVAAWIAAAVKSQTVA